MKVHGIYIYAALVVALLCTGCSRVIPSKDPYTIYMHLPAEPATLNPVTYSDAYSAAVFGYIYQSLIKRNLDTLEFEPQLAKRWTRTPDGLRYRFYLKKGVTWTDGKELTADDVVYSYRVIMDPKVASARLKVYYKEIARVRKIDRYTVEFVMVRPYFLALSICGGLTVIPKHIFDDGTDFNTHSNSRNPVGTGPYRFSRWSTGKHILLERNEEYHGRKPDIRKIFFKFVSEENIALQMLKKGDLDYMTIRPIQWVRQTGSDKFQNNFYKFEYYLPNYRFIAWNARTMFGDRRVRTAMTHLINRRAILEKLYFGLGKIVTGNFYINSDDYNTEIEPLNYDPEKGRQLLREAGWLDSNSDGFLDKDGKKMKFDFMIPSSAKMSERIATIVKEDLSRIGIQMTISRYEWAVFLQNIHTRDFDAATLGWSMGFESDPYQVWHSSQTQNGSNLYGFKDKEADRIIEQARTELDPERRRRLYWRFHEILHEEQPCTFLYCTPELVVLSKRFENVTVHTAGFDLEEWKVNPEYE